MKDVTAGQLFQKGDRIILSDRGFIDCVFNGCTLVYEGIPFRADGCDFSDLQWEFLGAAGETLNLLRELWANGDRNTVANAIAHVTQIPREQIIEKLAK